MEASSKSQKGWAVIEDRYEMWDLSTVEPSEIGVVGHNCIGYGVV